jgi:hypothetical protein
VDTSCSGSWPGDAAPTDLRDAADTSWGSIQKTVALTQAHSSPRVSGTAFCNFGCESDDVITAWAVDRHGNHRLHPIFSFDVGDFDVTDMNEGLEEAYALVEPGLITPDDFREFVFGNTACLHTDLNPNFFKDSVCRMP